MAVDAAVDGGDLDGHDHARNVGVEVDVADILPGDGGGEVDAHHLLRLVRAQVPQLLARGGGGGGVGAGRGGGAGGEVELQKLFGGVDLLDDERRGVRVAQRERRRVRLARRHRRRDRGEAVRVGDGEGAQRVEEAARRRLDGEVRLGRADDAREEDDGDLEARARREARRRELARVEDVGRLQERGAGCGWG